jgi:mRNA interferase MazF
MGLQRGDVVILDFPLAPGQPPKRRPAVVIQSDHNNARLVTAIFAMVSSNLQLAGREPTQVLVDATTSDGQAAGIVRTSVVKCENLYTLPQSIVVRSIGRLSPTLIAGVDSAIKTSLGLS